MVRIIPLFATVLSHLPLVPTLLLLISKNMLFDASVGCFGLIVSLLYHGCDSLRIELFLTSSQWHKLDNVGAISLIGLLMVHFSCITNPVADRVVKYAVFFVAMVSQEKHPWDIRFTFAPIILFSLIPIVQICIIDQRLPCVDKKNLSCGLFFITLGVFFFVLGLDDDADMNKLKHSMWHVNIGFASYFLWQTVKPQPRIAAKK